MIASYAAYAWACTVLTLALSLGWAIVDAIRLRRAVREDTSDPAVRDKIFGSLMGLVIAGFGFGVFYYHLA